MTVIVFDTETTGLSPQRDRIVAVAASTACGRREFSELVNPGVPIPPAASRVHGITDDQVTAADGWGGVGPRFWRWVRDAAGPAGRVTLVAHNGRRFDLPLLVEEMRRLPAPPEWMPAELRHVDTLAVARAAMAHLPSHRQAAVYEALFGAQPEGQHDALGDVRALRRIVGDAR